MGGIAYGASTYIANQVKYNDDKSVETALDEIYDLLEKNGSENKKDLNITISNVTSIGMNISVNNNISNIVYIYMVNNKIKGHTENKTLTIEDLEPGTNCKIMVIGIEQNGTIHKGETEVKIKDAVWLYKDGVNGSLSGGFSIQGYVGSANYTLVPYDKYMRLTIPVDKKAAFIRENSIIDFTKYKKVYIKAYNSNTNYLSAFISTKSNYNGNDTHNGGLGIDSGTISRAGDNLIKLDVSSLNKKGYVYFRKTHAGYADIKRIWME